MAKKKTHKKKARTFDGMKTITISGELVYPSAFIESYISSGKLLPLTERQRTVFEYKFGIKDGVIKTNSEVAEKFSISTTRVLQLYANVLYKMGCIS